MEKTILKILILILFTSCSHNVKNKKDIIDSTKYYFPLRNLEKGMDSISNIEISKILRDEFKEPVLYNKEANDKEVYRFFQLNNLTHSEIIRVENDNNLKLSKVYLKIEYLMDTVYFIPKEKFMEVKNNLLTNDFWNMISNDHKIKLDGDIWIIEGISNNIYHYVYRWLGNDNKFINLMRKNYNILVSNEIKNIIDKKYQKKYQKK